MKASDLETFLNDYLQSYDFKDYCPNGIQIEGKDEIYKIVTGVSATQKLIDYAVLAKADAIIVHHGVFWKGDPQALRSFRKNRIEKIIKNDLNLFAYHLPLDAHPAIGNNVQLAEKLDLIIDGACDFYEKHPLILKGHLQEPTTLENFINSLDHKLDHKSFYVGASNDIIENVAWCTGSAYDYIELAAQNDVDLFISGEIAERTVHEAEELGIAYIAAGHHCTEVLGIKKLGDLIAEKFDLDVEFVNFPTNI